MKSVLGILNQLVLAALLAAMCGISAAVEKPPDPLTLEYVLSTVNRSHPVIEHAMANRQLAAADRMSAESISGFNVDAILAPQAVRPVAEDDTVNDSYASIRLEKRLYDFGFSSSREAAAKAGEQAAGLKLLNARQQHYINLMRTFFAVILADMRYAADNEDMAYHYVTYDKVRQRHSLGQVSDVDLKKSESEYQSVLVRRSQSDAARSTTRSRLAIAMNQPEYLPANLHQPVLKNLDRKIPEYEQLRDEVLKNNTALQTSNAVLAAAEHNYKSVQAKYYPVISAGVESTYWEREIGSRNNMQAGLTIDIPLYKGGAARAELVRAKARLDSARARHRQQELDSHVAVLQIMERLQAASAELRAARIQLDYQDLELERSRALYEMEVQTSMGDKMTRMTEAQWRVASAEFGLALVWAEMDVLRGRLLADYEAGQSRSSNKEDSQ